MEAEAVICEVMAGWARRGYYELDALLAHVETCEICAVARAPHGTAGTPWNNTC